MVSKMHFIRALKVFFMSSGIANMVAYIVLSRVFPPLYANPMFTFLLLYANFIVLLYLYKENRHVIYVLIAHSTIIAVYSAILFAGIIGWQDSFWNYMYQKFSLWGVLPTVLVAFPIMGLLKLEEPQCEGVITIIALVTIILLVLYLRHAKGE